MVRHVFFSFHYKNDITRAMVVRNSQVTWKNRNIKIKKFIDKADIEKVQRQSVKAVHNWINEQIKGTSVTVVLIGSTTLKRRHVQYEIRESLRRGNGLIGIRIHKIKNFKKQVSKKGVIHTQIGCYEDGTPAYFDSVVDKIYDYVIDEGFHNLGTWIEASARKHEKTR
jgi:hypothetical protein